MVDGSGSMATDDRVFKVSDTEFTELSAIKFAKEKPMQELIQKHLDKMLGLKLLESEFSVDNGVYWLDTVAFDREKNTFVIIEYKNKLDTGVLDQARAYLNHMNERRDAFTLKYNKVMEHSRNTTDFTWKATYAIIVAPEFSKKQIGSAEGDAYLELYRIKLYGDGVIIMRRVGGAHKRVLGSTPKPGNGHPESVRDVDAAEKDYLDKTGASDATRTVWRKLKERVQSELVDTRFGMSQFEGSFYLPNRRLICRVAVKSDRVELSCDIKKDQELQTDNFFKYCKTYKDGTKNYKACVDTVAYIDTAVWAIHTIYNLKSNGGRGTASNS
ncbi:MAG: hypothetical protein OXP12_07340 [Thaumarchaeota archaeon]|nr:hypothetical protein [Nitrososphaerota archaeon]